MAFNLLLQPPKLDSLNVTLADIDGMEESMAIKLWERLRAARERTGEAARRR